MNLEIPNRSPIRYEKHRRDSTFRQGLPRRAIGIRNMDSEKPMHKRNLLASPETLVL